LAAHGAAFRHFTKIAHPMPSRTLAPKQTIPTVFDPATWGTMRVAAARMTMAIRPRSSAARNPVTMKNPAMMFAISW